MRRGSRRSPFRGLGKGGDAPVIEALSVTVNDTYTAPEGVDGYNPVTVNVPQSVTDTTITENGVHIPPSNMAGFSKATVIVPFYPREDTPLDLITSVETMDMHTEPTAGTLYYPIVYLATMHSPAETGEDWTPAGKYFAPTDANYVAAPYIDIIDIATGESVEGYPQRVHTSASFVINSGGYIRLKGWKVATSGNHLKVEVTTTRWNTTYSNPIDDTYSTQSVETWLSAYMTPPYVIKDDRWAVVEHGTFSQNTRAYWTIYRNGTTVIDGTGEIDRAAGWTKSLIKDVVFANGITLVNAQTFMGCTNLTSVAFSKTVYNTGSEGFRNCTKLTDVTIREGTTNIAWSCFRGCTALRELTLPSTLTTIGNYAIPGAVTTITVLATTPPSLGSNNLGGIQTIYVPYDSVDAYKTRWSSYANQIQPIVTIGDVIDLDTQQYHMYHMTEEDLTAVGIRVYGTQDGISMLTFLVDDTTQGTSSPRHIWTKNLSTTLYEGDYMDIYSASIDDSTTDPQSFQTFLAAYENTDKLWVKEIQQGGDILAQFSFIFKGATNEQSTPTRTLAMDPMTRSTLSTISDTLDPNIEDD